MADDPCSLIESLERDWRDALCARDTDRLQALIHPDFILIGSRSAGPFTMNRREWLEAVEKREVESIELLVKDESVFDQVMVGTVEARWRVRYLGRTIDDCVLLTDVWIRADDRWQVIRRHSSPLPPGECVGGTVPPE